MADLSVYDNDPTIYLFTSLTAGSSHIITATSRIETILKANKIPFKGVDTATDDLARKLYGRRASGKKLPLLVKEGFVLGDLEMIEEWNEYGELKEALGVTSVPAPKKPTPAAAPAASTPTPATATASTSAKQDENETPKQTPEQNLAIRQMGAEAAKVAAAKKPAPSNISTTNPLLAEKASTPVATPGGAGTPTKSADADKEAASGILSPRNVPLPTTPGPAATTGDTKPGDVTVAESGKLPSPTLKKDEGEESKEKSIELPKPSSIPVKNPPPTHVDSTDTTLDQPVKVSQPVAEASEQQIEKVEHEQAIPEVSNEEDEDEDDEEQEEEEEGEESAEQGKGDKDALTKASVGAAKNIEVESEVKKPVTSEASTASTAAAVATPTTTEKKAEEKPAEEESEEDEDEDEDEEAEAQRQKAVAAAAQKRISIKAGDVIQM